MLDVMPKEEVKSLTQRAISGDAKALAFLEACFALELAGASPDTRAATADMFLNNLNQRLSRKEQPANNIVRFSREHSPEEQAASNNIVSLHLTTQTPTR